GADGRQRGAGIHVAELVAFGEQVVEAREDIVAGDDRYFELRRGLQDGTGAGWRIYAAGVGDYCDVAGYHLGRDAGDERGEAAGARWRARRVWRGSITASTWPRAAA